jgi:hypothetical protein
VYICPIVIAQVNPNNPDWVAEKSVTRTVNGQRIKTKVWSRLRPRGTFTNLKTEGACLVTIYACVCAQTKCCKQRHVIYIWNTFSNSMTSFPNLLLFVFLPFIILLIAVRSG